MKAKYLIKNYRIYNGMSDLKYSLGIVAFLVMFVFVWTSNATAYYINDKFSIGGVLAGAYQYQSVSDDPDIVENTGRGALPIQPEFSFRPTERDEIFMKFGFAAGNDVDGWIFGARMAVEF
jgi:hypothetical protein